MLLIVLIMQFVHASLRHFLLILVPISSCLSLDSLWKLVDWFVNLLVGCPLFNFLSQHWYVLSVYGR